MDAIAVKRPRGRPPGRREPRTVPMHERLGFRPYEFAALIGVSRVTIWRWVKEGKIPTINENGIKIIPRSYAVKAGYIT